MRLRPVWRRFDRSCVLPLAAGLSLWMPFTWPARGGPLENYVKATDPHYNWKRTEQKKTDWGTLTHLEMVSQHWRDQFWSHHLIVARPNTVRNPAIGFLFITGDGTGEKQVEWLRVLATRAGAVAAVITQIPNQPLYGGREEDALIAYTFDQYLKTGDESWPLLFPMVKSAVRGLDTVQACVANEFNQKVERFVVSGASKRGWTTWLTGAVDPRVAALAPMVIDMLNMKAQLAWAETVYGKQSEEISDYTELNLHQKMDDPPMQKLRSWVDPYAYRARYTMPKLLLLGTNDPYWTVDSLRHYWDELPGPKLLFQTPNAGHDLAGGQDALQTLAAFFQIVADGQPLPRMTWRQTGGPGKAAIEVTTDQPAAGIRLWTATSKDRDFRDETWASRALEVNSGSASARATVETPDQGYRAYLAEVELRSPTGHPYKLSTEARVTPDRVR